MRLAVLALLVAAQLLPVTHLTVDLPEPPEVLAGEELVLDGRVQLHGPTGPWPGAGTEVDLRLDAPALAGCELLADSRTLHPTAGQMPFQLACRPGAPGEHPVSVRAEAEPHGPGTWSTTLVVHPDRLTGTLQAGPPAGFQVPLTLALQPEHLDTAPVEIELSSDLAGSPLGFDERHGPSTARAGTPIRLGWTALHGPGTYTLNATVEGPLTEPWASRLDLVVPTPPVDDTLVVNLTVLPPSPSVTLTSDSVNDDGKRKRPGETLITRLDTEHTDTVDVRVLRPVGNRTVLLDQRSVPVDPDGAAEHRFSHPQLPAGPLIVQAQAGDTSVARTAQVLDAPTSVTVTGPAEARGDGRAVELEAGFLDENLGSTPTDPGPVWGLPDITWTVFRGTQPAPGWNVTLGAFTGGPEGTAELSRLAWPEGATWATVTDGRAEVPVRLSPPLDVDPGTYRLSLYDPDGDRIGGHTLDLEPAPTLDLTAGTPMPLSGWPVNVTVTDPVPDMVVNLTARADEVVVGQAADLDALSTTLPLDQPLAAGTSLSLEAWATWPGRPPSERPDAVVTATVPALAPLVEAWTSLDGRPLPAPLAVHPAGAHEIEIQPAVVDPNGDPVDLDLQVVGPAGDPVGWEVAHGDPLVVQVPADQPAGRYAAELVARTPEDDPVVHRVPIDVAPVTRLAVQGPADLSLEPGAPGRLNVTVTNTGTSTFDGLVADLRGPDGLQGTLSLAGQAPVALGEIVPLSLAPGSAAELVLELDATDAEAGTHEVKLTVAGVIP